MAECCTDGTRLIYSCSGASNVGEIADRVARKLRAEGFGKMTCLAFKIRIFLNPPSGCGCCGNSWQLDSKVIRVFAIVKNLKSKFGGVKKTNSEAEEINSSLALNCGVKM